MEEQALSNYKQAGRVVAQAKDEAREIVEAGISLHTLAEEIEEFIRSQGLEPAFPVNTSVNDEAAHYTPAPDDERSLQADDVVKVDIGAQKEGYIADSAVTLNPSGRHQERITQVENMLEKGLEHLEPGMTIGELGTFIYNQAPADVSVVRNLTGHSIERYEQHAGVSIPNIRNSNPTVLETGDVIAVEPFISEGSGKVRAGEPGNIYKQQSSKVRGRNQRQLLKKIEKFNQLPFTPRWIEDFGGRQKMVLQKLVKSGSVKSYEVLKDSKGGNVYQAEHTVIIGENDGENIITTRD